MRRTNAPARALRVNLIAAAVASCFVSANAVANPTGANVVNGVVTMSTPGPGQLHITNSPNSIIHWNGFSIGAGELTRFIQQSPASAVLNRVVTNSPSEILGQLLSNGRVFLINPNGIVFGAGSVVDVAGLVASSLNLSDANFLAGRYLFEAVPGAGRVDNFGSIQAGQVYLVGPAVSNGDVITSPQGEVVLAAGNSVELMNPGTPELTVSITASGNEALNLGQVLADSGRIGIYAGLINQQGTVSANAAFLGVDGSIKLRSTTATTFAAGSDTFASGALDIVTGDLTVAGSVQSGPQTIAATGAVVVANEPGGFAQLAASGGQSISARSLEVAAQGGGFASIFNDGAGSQTIAINGGGTSAGIDVRALPGTGVASISNNALGGEQTIQVIDADHFSVDGAGVNSATVSAITGTQVISITGSGANALNLGSAGAQGASQLAASRQFITAGAPGENGSITIIGSAANSRLAGMVSQPGVGGTQDVSTSGNLSITGGSASAQPNNFPAGIFHNGTGQQTINAQSIVLQGGATGAGNSAQIGANNGTQVVNAGSISLTGGALGTGNSTQLRASLGSQSISAGQMMLTAGSGGTSNFAVVTAPLQNIAVTGDLSISGGGSLSSPSAGGGSLIGGGGPRPTNLALSVGGNLTLNGGSAAGSVIGGNNTNIQRNDIVVNVGGDVVLNAGTAVASRIGAAAGLAAGGNIDVTAGGAIALNSAAPGNASAIRTTENVTLRAREITQGADATIQAGTLTLQTQQGASLVGANSVNAFNAMNAMFGDVRLHNSAPLLMLTGVQNPGGAFALQQAGDALVNGSVSSGPQTVDITGTLTVRGDATSAGQLSASGGQTINAYAIDVVAQDGASATVSNNGFGDQIITVAGGGTSAGLDVRTAAGGGFAHLFNFTPGLQSISVSDADHVHVDGAGGGAADIVGSGAQWISIAGGGANAINLGSAGALGASAVAAIDQNVTAGISGQAGSVTITGSATNGRISGFISNPGPGSQAVSTSGALTIIGGDASAQPTNFPAGIFHNGTGQQTVTAQSILVQGGANGAGNSAQIGANNGTQLVSAGSIALIGGADGTGNNAQIRASQGLQSIVADQISLTAGAGGTDNFVTLTAPAQNITVSGDLSVTGSGSLSSPSAGGGARIGGRGGAGATPTNLLLTVGGDTTLTGGTAAGAGAAIGSSPSGPAQPNQITMNVGGDVTLNPGSGAGARIGSPEAHLAGGTIEINAGGGIALNSTSPEHLYTFLRTTGDVTLRAQSVTQGEDAKIYANTLSVETQQGASLVGANIVNSFNAINAMFGDIALNNGAPLLTLTSVQNFGGAFALQQTGDALVNGGVISGPQTISVSGGLVVQNAPGSSASLSASGGQQIDAAYVKVEAQAGGDASILNFGGDQRISTTGSDAAGDGLAVRNLGGTFAGIQASGGNQSIEVRDADRAIVDGAFGAANIVDFDGMQSIQVTGGGANALVLGSAGALAQAAIAGGSHQTVVAGDPGEQGSITLYGTATGGPANTFIVSSQAPGGTQSVSTSGALTVFGGTAPSGSAAGIFANGIDGQQTVRAGSILLRGGAAGSGNSAFIGANNGSQLVEAGAGGIALIGGAGGANNFVQINQQSSSATATQTVRSQGPVLIQGGDAGTFNFAMIRAFGAHQSLEFGDTTLLGGASGLDNFALIQARSQDIAVHGDLALIGRGSAGSPTTGGGARIGGLGSMVNTPTSLVLSIDGNLAMTGGSVAGTGALLGNSTGVTAPTNIAVSAGGDVTLDGGTAPNTFATIGSRAANLAGGDIDITAGGTIALNSSAPDAAAVIRTADGVTLRAQQVTQGPDARIEAGSLDVQTAQGASLAGANSVSQLAMLNSASGDVAFNNASTLLTVTGIDQVSNGALDLSQSGDLLITGDVASGAQTISATGDLTISPQAGSNASVRAYGPASFSAGGKFSLLGGSAWNGFAQAVSDGTMRVQTGGDLLLRGGSGLLAYALLYGKDDVRLTVGNELRIDAGTGLLAFARVQTDFWDRITLSFPNRESGGYFVNGREGATFRGLSGFYAGLLPAIRGRSLIVSYGE
jgi:filamentous hemagglutinin family protein